MKATINENRYDFPEKLKDILDLAAVLHEMLTEFSDNEKIRLQQDGWEPEAVRAETKPLNAAYWKASEIIDDLTEYCASYTKENIFLRAHIQGALELRNK